MSNENDGLQSVTRTKLDDVSRALLRLHKALLDDERIIYEVANGAVNSPHEMFQLVLNHPQFTWLGKISSLIALLDEAASIRRPATETSAQALLAEATALLKLEIDDATFTERFQRVLRRSPDAKAYYDEALKIATKESTIAPTADKETLRVVHNPAENRFEMKIENHLAIVNYRQREDGVYNLYHAGVPPELEGRGYGSQLVKGTLDLIRGEGKEFIPTCPFIAAYVRRHPEYQEFATR